MILTDPNKCRECSKPLAANRREGAEFCGTPCRVSWRNRRMSRGADLYDAFMALRYDRKDAKIFGLWALMCRLASMWHEEDKAAKRQTYFPPEKTAAMHSKRA